MIDESRIMLFSADSTGMLETLSQNIPTIAFWQNGLGHVRESARPYYQLLFDAGIVHLSPISVAGKINEIWNDVDGWWASREVQEARMKFCERYARLSENRVDDIFELLIK